MFGKRCFFAVLISLFVCAAAVFADDEKSVISIENAQKTEYKKDAVTGADTIVLTGGVRISVARGSTKTIIFADLVNYNRETDMMYAEGNVRLEQTGSKAGGESVTAKSLLFNTATLEGIFDNGRVVQTQSDALNLPSGSTLNVASTIFGRDSGGTIAFKNGELTFCDDDDPHWRIKASRIWLLPGGEFAFLNAFLFVGKVPLLYLPAFYYPKDELIFNPAFGYRNREGYYINTTTYLIGRKPLEARSSAEANKAAGSTSEDDSDDKINFFSLMKTNALKEQRREGIVLHNLDDDFTGDTTQYLKLMADYYANLGVMAGLDGVFKPNDVVSKLEGKVQLGWSNTIFKTDAAYIPYASNGESYSDSSHFLGIDMPFRYMANFNLSISKPFSLTLALPMYSDPYFDYDFNNRAETMDWIDFLMSNPSSDSDELSISEMSSFTWSLNGSYTFKLPAVITPYVSTLSVSTFSSSLVFSALSNTSEDFKSSNAEYQTASPERKFYYPSQITPFKSSVRLAGTLVQIPAVAKKTTSTALSVALSPPASLNPDEQNDELPADASEADETQEADEREETPLEEHFFSDTALPLLATATDSLRSFSDISYTLSYSIVPDFTSQFSYAATNLTAPEDFSWSDLQSTYYRVTVPTTLTSTLGYRDSFVSLTDTFSFTPVYQDHPYLKELDEQKTNGGYAPASIASTKTADYNARKLDLTDVNALSFRPFYYTEHFSETALTWNTTIKMIRTNYIGTTSTDGDIEKEWEFLTTDLTDEESLTEHNLNLVLAAKEGDFSQKLSLTTTLPPQVDAYRGVFSLSFPYTTFSVGTGIKRTSQEDDTWIKEDFTQSLAVSLFNSKLSFTQSWLYNLEESYHDSFKLALSGYGVQLAYTMSYVSGYYFEQGKGWIAEEEKEFQPYSVSLAYTSGTKNFTYWTERIAFAPSLSTSIVYDCIRPTNSYFRFIPAITFKINNFLNITFSSESRNSVIYRYFGSDTETYYGPEVETNIFKDLVSSFHFEDDNRRKNSGFKLQSFNIAVTHDLHDWDLACEFTIKPRYITETGQKPYYDFSPYFSISVAWRPMESMKTQVVDEYGEWELNP